MLLRGVEKEICLGWLCWGVMELEGEPFILWAGGMHGAVASVVTIMAERYVSI